MSLPGVLEVLMLDVLSDMLVEIRQGRVQGCVCRTVGGKEYFSFKGIPYAQPPVDKLRFKPPRPVKSWSGIRHATKEGSVALQWDEKKKCVIGSEDCLYLNVHTPRLQPNKEPMAVVVYIHHGGFTVGSGNSDIFGPDYFIENDVVFVSMNYRLGAFGFLCLHTKHAPGNVGLRDQSLALAWVQENISVFGGHPGRVTIMGISAGSASVEYQTLSTMSRGLYNKAICMSGSALNPWARSSDPVGSAFNVAKSLGCEATEVEDLLKFYMEASPEELVLDTSCPKDEYLVNGELFPFKPVIESRIDGVTPFLCENPIKLYKSGNFSRVLTLMGMSEKDGMVFKTWYSQAVDGMRKKEFIAYLPKWLQTKSLYALKDMFKKIYKQKTEDLNKDDYIYDYLTDLIFVGGIYSSLLFRRKYNDQIYLYKFSYDSKVNFLKNQLGVKEKGATHIDEVSYLAHSCEANNDGFTHEDELVRSRMVEMFTNFIKHGKPIQPNSTIITDVNWTHVSNDINYLDIGKDLVAKSDPWPERMTLWSELYTV